MKSSEVELQMSSNPANESSQLNSQAMLTREQLTEGEYLNTASVCTLRILPAPEH